MYRVYVLYILYTLAISNAAYNTGPPQTPSTATSDPVRRASPKRDTTMSVRLDLDLCYRALGTRDRRFDGRFFIAVKTTGIYCRPICPARTPRPENVTFFPTPAAAEEAG